MLLYQGGLLGRTPLPLRNAYGASRAVYYIDRAGIEVLKLRGGEAPAHPVLTQQPASEFFLEHALDTADVRISFELACRERSYPFTWVDETRLRRDGIEYLLAQWVDIHGTPRVKGVPASALSQFLGGSAGFAGAATVGMGQGPHSHDLIGMPDFGGYTVVPWEEGVARVPLDITVDGKAWPYCSRTTLKRALERLAALGYQMKVGVEAEHMLVTRAADGRIRPFDPTGSDTLEKPCYDFKGLAANLGYLRDLTRYMEQMGWEPFTCLQPQYNLLTRFIEWEVLPVCINEGLGVIPWSPLRGGWLSGKYRRGMTAPVEGTRIADAEKQGWGERWSRYNNEFTWQVLDALHEAAEESGKTPAQIALNWVLNRPGVTSPIIGARKMEQLDDNIAATGWKISDDVMEKLNRASEPESVYPYDHIAGAMQRR